MKKILSLVLALAMICAMATTAFAADITVGGTADESNTQTITITNNETDDTDSIYADGNSWNIGVQAGFDDTAAQAGSSADVYYVVVTWEVRSTLKYTLDNDAYCWTVYSDVSDEENKVEATSGEAVAAGYILNYDKGTWSGKANINVTVTNWSNVDVAYSMTWTPATTATDNDKVHTDLVFADGAVTIDAGTTLAAVVAKDAAETNKLYTTAASATSTVSIDGDVEGGITGAIKANDALIGTLTVTINKVEQSTPTDPSNP